MLLILMVQYLFKETIHLKIMQHLEQHAGSAKSFIKGTKGNNVETPSELSTDSNFVDFEKMYIQIVNEQQMLIEKSKEHIMGPNIEITSPGIYTINNAATNEYEMNAENTNTVYSGATRLFY